MAAAGGQQAGGAGALAGKGALVTGGAGGLGKASARALLRDGASVMLMGRTEETLRAAAEQLRPEAPKGATVSYIVGDSLKAADVAAAVEAAAAPTGNLTMAVSVVGGGVMAPFLLFDEEMIASELNRNVVSSFLVIKYATPLMVQAGGGSVVCISSTAAKIVTPFMTGYCAGKAALEALVRSAAEELGHLQVRVNAVRPGMTQTDSENSRRQFAQPDLMRRFVELKPLGRTGFADDIAAGVRYLAGPESSWLTGQSFAIDGGNELRSGIRLEQVARQRWGDEAVDIAMSGRLA